MEKRPVKPDSKSEWREIFIDEKRVSELEASLAKDPRLQRIRALTAKVIEGNITVEEKNELNELTKSNLIPGHIDDRSREEIARNPRKLIQSSD